MKLVYVYVGINPNKVFPPTTQKKDTRYWPPKGMRVPYTN